MKDLTFHMDFYNPIFDAQKRCTTRLKPKDLEVGEEFRFVFVPDDTGFKELYGQVERVEVVRFCDLNRFHAETEGYIHEDLLKHEIRNIYPDVRPFDLCYIYYFFVLNSV